MMIFQQASSDGEGSSSWTDSHSLTAGKCPIRSTTENPAVWYTSMHVIFL